MFLKPYATFNPVAICQALRRPLAFSTFRCLASVGFACSGTQTCEPTPFSKPVLQASGALQQSCGHRPMLWTNSLTSGGFHGVPHSNIWCKRLASTQPFVQRLAPFGGAIALSAGSQHLRNSNVSRSKRRHALEQGAMLIETSTPASLQQAGTASTSSSDSDAGPYSSGGNGIPYDNNRCGACTQRFSLC